MDVESISSGGIAGALVYGISHGVRYLHARSRTDNAREDKRLSDCEERFRAQTAATAELGQRMDALQSRYSNDIVTALIKSAQAMTEAAEVQREGNAALREQTAVISRLCVKIDDATPPHGNPTK